MTTLQSIGFTLAGGTGVSLLTFLAFGLAERYRSTNIAPRCTARHPNTIYNPTAKYYAPDTQNKNGETTHTQYRGWPAVGWIFWTMSLSYDVMLRGVPGTGTRKGGTKGRFLNVNLDAIVLFRFHRICLKVTFLATILGIGVCLPMYYTSPCYNLEATNADELNNCTLTSSFNHTNFEKMTLKNIPPVQIKKQEDNVYQDSSIIRRIDFTSVSARLYVLVICTWVIVLYTLRLIKREWVWMLAMRRVYYLEENHWEKRIDELDSIIADDSDEEVTERNEMENRRKINMRRSMSKKKSNLGKSNYRTKRDPWIPHPEQRETIPSIELYSVLVGGLPSLPKEVLDEADIEAVRHAQQESIDWQLSLASTVFDHCIPNQPGFSSSVAAVTIIPDAHELALAWRKWYVAAAALRRLTFVRKLMAEKRHFDIEIQDSDLEKNSDSKDISSGKTTMNYTANQTEFQRKTPDLLDDAQHVDVYKDIEQLQSFYRKIFGNQDHEDIENLLYNALDFGPEQSAVYSREFAQGAAACCPNGCCEERLYRMSIDELESLERDCIDRVQQAYLDLQQAQSQAILSAKPKSKTSIHHDETDHKNNIKKQKLDQGEEVSNKDKQKQINPGHNRTSSLDVNKFPEKLETEANLLEKLAKSPGLSLTSKPDYMQKKGSKKPISLTQNTSTKSLASATTQKMGSPKQKPSDKTQLEPLSFEQEHSFEDNSCDGVYPLPSYMRHQTAYSPTLPGKRFEFASSAHNPASFSNQSFALTPTGNFRFKRSYEDLLGMNEFNSIPSGVHVPDVSLKVPDESNEEGNLLGPVNQNIEDNFNIRESSNVLRPRLNTDASSCRRRLNTDSSFYSRPRSEQSEQRKKFESILNEHRFSNAKVKPDCATGSYSWNNLNLENLSSFFRGVLQRMKSWCFKKTKKAVDELARESTFAVVTFTSRQAAVAARRCLADARGDNRWVAVENLPIPPLADAASMDLRTCRGCCRPVTMSINQRQQFFRKAIATILLAIMFVGYSIPITLIAQLSTIEKLATVWPALEDFAKTYPFARKFLSGIVPALLFTLFFALCPVIFRAIANSGSNAVSLNQAEYRALRYYWFFMLFTAFAGTAIGSMLFDVFRTQQKLENESFQENLQKRFQRVFIEVAGTLPSSVAANWLNWIIIRTTMTLPLQYMLQVNTFIFQWLGWKCCRRCVMGGGPGGHIPYRIYIDSGVVFLCVVALSPTCPLVAPVALLYYLYCMPLWRRNAIFIYRPKFDTGGLRWPFLSDMCITSMIVGQIFLVIMLSLKEAFGAAIFAAVSIFLIAYFRHELRNRFYKAYIDVSLLQSSVLDGWDYTNPLSLEEREKFRRFLVDAHKAAYIPICIAGDKTNILTAEPALTVPLDSDVDILSTAAAPPSSTQVEPTHASSPVSSVANTSTQSYKPGPRSVQHGASYRRVSDLHSINNAIRLMEFQDDDTINSFGFQSLKSSRFVNP